jgi:hypothetical protein
MLHSVWRALGRALAPWGMVLIAVGVVGLGLLVMPVIMMISPGGPLDPAVAVLGAVLLALSALALAVLRWQGVAFTGERSGPAPRTGRKWWELD